MGKSALVKKILRPVVAAAPTAPFESATGRVVAV